MMRCVQCNTEFVRRRGKNIFCQPCALERRLKTKREYAARRSGIEDYKPIGSVNRCNHCGCEILKDHPARRLCSSCKKFRRSESYSAFRKSAKGLALYRRINKQRASKPERALYMAQYRGPYDRARRAQPMHKLNHRMSTMVGRGLRDGKQGKSWVKLLGYDLPELMTHIERQFSEGMSWGNIGAWHVDHIIPLSSFVFDGPSDSGFKSAWALTNLRPLWAEKNIAKRNLRELLL